MIQVYADDLLVYDSRDAASGLVGLSATTGVNKGGVASITMPPGHRAYNSFTSYKTIVEIYKDGELRFRGRAIYPTDDFYNRRTITCEGEMCLLRDVIIRPYLYQDTTAAIFTDLIGQYNAVVESRKQFVLGTITVTDPNDYIRLESTEAEPIGAVIDKLLERCGGYIEFTTNSSGFRVINWLTSLGRRSGQEIAFGENLMDFSRTDSDVGPITRLIPYGAKDDTTGERLTIIDVNNGVDYVQDDAAVALRGVIEGVAIWDDVTIASNLYTKALAYLATASSVVTSLQVTAADLSNLGADIDTFHVGDLVRVRSAPHGVDEDFLVTDRTEDLLLDQSGSITLGKAIQSLTGSDVANADRAKSDLHAVERDLRAEYQTNVAAKVEEAQAALTTLIQQTTESILLEVSEEYTTNGELEEQITSRMTQLSDEILIEFNTLRAVVDDNDASTRTRFDELSDYIRISGGVVTLGASDSPLTLSLENDMIVFRRAGQQIGWWDGTDFHTGNIIVEVTERAQFGNFAFVPRSNGSLSFLKVR